jgi:hypothetical protein
LLKKTIASVCRGRLLRLGEVEPPSTDHRLTGAKLAPVVVKRQVERPVLRTPAAERSDESDPDSERDFPPNPFPRTSSTVLSRLLLRSRYVAGVTVVLTLIVLVLLDRNVRYEQSIQ